MSVAVLAVSLAAMLAPGSAANANPATTESDPHAATTFQQDAAHDGSTDDSSFQAPLTRAWTAQLNGPVSYPIVADQRVFVDVAHGGAYGTDVEALDLQTGATLWGPVSIGGTYSFGGLAWDNGTLFALNGDGMLTAFSAATGSVLWTANPPDGQYDFGSPPTAVDGTVYFQGGGHAGTLYAVDEADGAFDWSAPDAAGGDGSPSVDSTGITVLEACGLAEHFAFDGTRVWTRPGRCAGGGGLTAPLHSGVVYARDDASDSASELDETTGTATGTFVSSQIPALHGDLMATVTAGRLAVTDLSTDTQAWSATSTDVVTAPLIANGYVIAGHANGVVDVRSIQDGALVWSGTAGSSITELNETQPQPRPTPAVGDGDLAVPAGTQLTVFEPAGDTTVRLTGPADNQVVRGAATYTFTSSVPNARYVCSVDFSIGPCTSPVRLGRLTGGTHHFTVAVAYAADGGVSRSIRSDVTAPVVRLAAFAHRVSSASSERARWSASDNPAGIASYQVRLRHGRGVTNLGPWQPPHSTRSRSYAFAVRTKSTGCVSVRATDKVGNISAWTPQRCVSRP